MKNLILLALAMIFAGCSAPGVSVPEALQMKQGDKLYTQYNIWYLKPSSISCLNIQKGRILQVGTEVEVIDSTTEKLTIRDCATQIEYTINFDGGLRMSSMQEFVREILTTESPDEFFAGETPENLRHIKNGEVLPGMTRMQVYRAYGPPARSRTPSLKNSTWIYWADKDMSVRVNFRGDVVRSVDVFGN